MARRLRMDDDEVNERKQHQTRRLRSRYVILLIISCFL
jgi:hypothetical protein